MENIWKGMLAPWTKHRLGTGDIRNHVEIVSQETEWDEDEQKWVAHVEVGFHDSDGDSNYIYDVDVDGPDDEVDLDTVIDEFLTDAT